jgi:anti-sigma B factor antagonist
MDPHVTEEADSAPLVMVMPDEIDVRNADQVYDRLSAAVMSGAGAPVVIADLSGTEFCDTAGAFCLLMIRHQAAARGGGLRLVTPPPVLRRILVLLEVDHLLPVYTSVSEACGPPAGPQHPLLMGLSPADGRPLA